jgi:hypothetical protein
MAITYLSLFAPGCGTYDWFIAEDTRVYVDNWMRGNPPRIIELSDPILPLEVG